MHLLIQLQGRLQKKKKKREKEFHTTTAQARNIASCSTLNKRSVKQAEVMQNSFPLFGHSALGPALFIIDVRTI